MIFCGIGTPCIDEAGGFIWRTEINRFYICDGRVKWFMNGFRFDVIRLKLCTGIIECFDDRLESLTWLNESVHVQSGARIKFVVRIFSLQNI